MFLEEGENNFQLFRVSFYLFCRLFKDFDRKFAYLWNIDRISMELLEFRCPIYSIDRKFMY